MGPFLKIAVADDEQEVREYFAAALERLGHHIAVVAANGQELIQKCREDRPDLLITDIRMDGVSGIDAMRALSIDEPLLTILVSAQYQPDEVEQDLDEQVLEFLPKPVKIADLMAAVAKAAARDD